MQGTDDEGTPRSVPPPKNDTVKEGGKDSDVSSSDNEYLKGFQTDLVAGLVDDLEQ